MCKSICVGENFLIFFQTLTSWRLQTQNMTDTQYQTTAKDNRLTNVDHIKTTNQDEDQIRIHYMSQITTHTHTDATIKCAFQRNLASDYMKRELDIKKNEPESMND
jgi:hypothetical protein